MIIIYQEHIDVLEKEVAVLANEVRFLRKLLEYKSLGPPLEADQNVAPNSTSAPEPTSDTSS